MKFKYVMLLAMPLLCISGFKVEAAEKTIGTACSSDQNNVDWDTIGQCSNGTFSRVSPFLAGGLAINMGSTAPSSTVDISGNLTIGGTYAGVNTAPTNGLLVQGVIGIGTTSPVSGASLDLGTKTDSLLLPSGTTAQEPASPKAGMMRYNNTTNVIEYYNGSAWIPFNQAGAPAGSGYFVLTTHTYTACMNPSTSNSATRVNATTAQITTNLAHGLSNGATVTTAGFVPAAYNVTGATITVTGTTTFTYPVATDPGTSSTTTGSYCSGTGGLAAGNAACLTELTTNNGWFGYAQANAAGLLNSTHVKAFLCDGTNCNNPNANTPYYFGFVGDNSAGGANFTTNGSGLGPNNNYLWFNGNAFSSISRTYWTGRGTSGTTAWPSTSAANTCSGWASLSTNGEYGASYNSVAGRWDYGNVVCSNNIQLLICLVNP